MTPLTAGGRVSVTPLTKRIFFYDTDDHWLAMSMTPLTGGVNDTAHQN
jgi:hypothetical protein